MSDVKEYMRKYIRERYHNDSEFRERLKSHIKKWRMSEKGKAWFAAHHDEYRKRINDRYHNDPVYREQRKACVKKSMDKKRDYYNAKRREKYASQKSEGSESKIN